MVTLKAYQIILKGVDVMLKVSQTISKGVDGTLKVSQVTLKGRCYAEGVLVTLPIL